MTPNEKPNNIATITIAVFASFCGLVAFVIIVGLIASRITSRTTSRETLKLTTINGTIKVDAPRPTNSPADPAPAREQFNGVIAVPDEIWASYEKNVRAADSVYQFQQVRLFGRVSEVGRDIIHGDPQIVFAAKGKRSSGEVQCVFDTSSATNQKRASSVKPGDQVEIDGMCGGKQGNTVMLLQCRINKD